MNMSTFNELVQKEDRTKIIRTIKEAIDLPLNISIDDLITFTKRVKSEYRKNTIHNGICSAMRTIVNKYDYNDKLGLLFLDWVIAVLIAYKNEYNNI